MTERVNGGEVHRSDPIHTPAPVAQTDLARWESDDRLVALWNETVKALDRITDGAHSRFDELEQAMLCCAESFKCLEREVAELTGAMDVMRSLGHVGLRIRGVFDAAAEYLAHDVVVRNGSSFVAKRDKPGACPGEGWELVASKGNRGERGGPGPRGMTGGRGEPAPAIKRWLINKKEFTASPILSDGTVGAPLELKSLFQEFLDQTRAGA